MLQSFRGRLHCNRFQMFLEREFLDGKEFLEPQTLSQSSMGLIFILGVKASHMFFWLKMGVKFENKPFEPVIAVQMFYSITVEL